MQSPEPLVTIITPVYRSADTLPAALNSLYRQSEWRWESIIVDDGSPDESRQVAGDYARRDPRYRVMSQKNAGACAARNTGLTLARGRYVLFLDADDWLEAGALSALVRACEKKQWSAVHGKFRYALADGMLTQWTSAYAGDPPLFEALSSTNVLSLPSCAMVRRSLLDEIGVFDTSLVNCGDWDLWVRVARSECRIGHIDDIVTGYRMRKASLSHNPANLLRDAKKVLTRIHSNDARVKRPSRRLEMGANPAQLPGRIAGFTLYAAALAAMHGNTPASDTAFNSLDRWVPLAPERIAEFLLHAACFSRCISPDDLRPVPRDVQCIMDQLIAEIARRTGVGDLANQVGQALEKLGFGRDQDVMRIANRQRLERPLAADETLPLAYLRSLALQECGLGA